MGSPYKNSEKAGGIIQGRQSLNDFGQDQLRFPKPDEPKSSQVLIIGRESVVHWKENAGKNKDWRIADPLGKKHCFRRDCQSSQKHLKERMQVLITSSLHDQGSTTYSAIRAVSLPRSMLKGLECRTKMAHLKTLVRAQINIERKAKEYHKNSRFRCSQLSRKDRQKNRNKIKDLYDISGSGEFDCSAADSEDDHAPINVNPSNDCWNTTQNDARETARKTNQQDTDRRVLAVPYESYNGAIIGNRYVLRMLVNTKPCCEIYDVHDGFSSNNGMHLIAKAYSICGTKGKERDARVKNLKRNTKKPNLVDVIDQNGKKWLFFPYSSCSIIKSNTQGVPVDWLREGEYNLHFPSLNPYNRILSALEGRYPKSYASCLQSGQVEPENSPKGKNQRARDRQRRKRKENRLAKASMLDNTKTKGSTPDKDYSLTENLNLISTHRNSLDLDDDIQKVTPSSYVKVQERGNKILVSPTLSSYSIAGIENPNSVPTSRIEARDENPALTSPAWREIPSQRKGKSGEQCHCFRASFSNPREHRHTSNATAAERYLQALDTITGYGRFHDIDEHIWQRFTSGPAVGLKNRFFEILEELRMNFEIEKDTFRLELAQSKRQRMIDLLRISYSPVIRYRTSQLNRIPQMHSEEEYAAFKDYVFSIYGNENASRALQFLHETFDNSSYSEREELNLLESVRTHLCSFNDPIDLVQTSS
ncbi:MAG: hypothetical protein LQ351_007414 [Letrouitia transgressa]|nr:MAG: hypothetical protein LQ351_007414 [Letrouitia transgressa]